jgi:predicted amidophosphoribosyltransferase
VSSALEHKEEVMFCTKCGKQVEGDGEFCTQCGVQKDSTSPSKPKKSHKTRNIVIGVVVGVVGLFFALAVILRGHRPDACSFNAATLTYRTPE